MENKKINIGELRKEYKELTRGAIEFYVKDCQREGKGIRAIKNKLQKENQRIFENKNAKHVQEMTITIEWKKSSMWGFNPSARVHGQYFDGTTFFDEGFNCSGCGYDKESTTLSKIFNKYLRYKLYEARKSKKRVESFPYGATLKSEFEPYFDYGVGTSCYYRIVEALGGKMQNVASGKSFDVYQVNFKK